MCVYIYIAADKMICNANDIFNTVEDGTMNRTSNCMQLVLLAAFSISISIYIFALGVSVRTMGMLSDYNIYIYKYFDTNYSNLKTV